MSFPPHDVIQSELMFYRLLGIAQGVTEAIAETGIEAEVAHTPHLTQYVKVPLESGGGVTLAPDTQYPGAWHIYWPTSARVITNGWPLDTEKKTLIDIVAAAVLHGIHGRELPSPFCWGHIEHGPMTTLADCLVVEGVTREAIELMPLLTLGSDGEPSRSSEGLRSLRLLDRTDPDRTLVVHHHERHGWSVDQVMPFTGASGRLDVAAALGLTPRLPRVGPDDVKIDQFARLLAKDTFWLDATDVNERHLSRYGLTPTETTLHSKDGARRAAEAWLAWAGYGVPSNRRSRRTDLLPSVELIVDWGEKQVGLPAVQRYMGIAAASDRVPILIVRSWFSRNARAWSEKAGMLLFQIDDEGILRPVNDHAAAATPVHRGEALSHCEDATCAAIGCVLESEFCPSERGRPTDPEARRWRL